MSSRFGVFIGRFQPFHNGHLATVMEALGYVDELVIAIGSCNVARNIKNPWSAAEREMMILQSLTESDSRRIRFCQLNDYMYNDNMWVSQVQNKIDEATFGSDDVTLFGYAKDRTSYYLSLFPQWKCRPSPYVPGLEATKIRDRYFDCDLGTIAQNVPAGVYEFLKECMMANATTPTTRFLELQSEFQHIASYKEAWKGAPYPPTFVTTDAVVVKSGHVLVVRRKCQPGKGLLALPGGFLGQNEAIVDGCIRELKEETRISESAEELKRSIVDQRVFDHPDRSLRGRTITHAFCIDLGSGPLPKVKGSDDAEKALWIPIREVTARGSEFYEDHCSIVAYFTNRF